MSEPGPATVPGAGSAWRYASCEPSSPSRCAFLSSRSGAVQNQHKWWLTCPEPDGDGGDLRAGGGTWAAHSVMRACSDRILDSQRPCRTSWASSCLGQRTTCDLSRRLSQMAHHRATRQDTNAWGDARFTHKATRQGTPRHRSVALGVKGSQVKILSARHMKPALTWRKRLGPGAVLHVNPKALFHTYSASIQRERACAVPVHA